MAVEMAVNVTRVRDSRPVLRGSKRSSDPAGVY